MFFSRADAVTLQETKCWLCQRLALSALLAPVPLLFPGDRGHLQPLDEGQHSNSEEASSRDAPSPFYFLAFSHYTLVTFSLLNFQS